MDTLQFVSRSRLYVYYTHKLIANAWFEINLSVRTMDTITAMTPAAQDIYLYQQFASCTQWRRFYLFIIIPTIIILYLWEFIYVLEFFCLDYSYFLNHDL